MKAFGMFFNCFTAWLLAKTAVSLMLRWEDNYEGAHGSMGYSSVNVQNNNNKTEKGTERNDHPNRYVFQLCFQGFHVPPNRWLTHA